MNTQTCRSDLKINLIDWCTFHIGGFILPDFLFQWRCYYYYCYSGDVVHSYLSTKWLIIFPGLTYSVSFVSSNEALNCVMVKVAICQCWLDSFSPDSLDLNKFFFQQNSTIRYTVNQRIYLLEEKFVELNTSGLISYNINI